MTTVATSIGAFPPPLWGRVREGGRCEIASSLATPNPNPSPQGGGEQAGSKAY